MADEEDFSKLPTEDKLAHKVWKVRMMGYEEAAKQFKRIDDENSPEYSKYTGLVRKFPVESNAFAQEKALAATLAFVECASAASKICSEVISGVVLKCLNAKPKTKELGIAVCLMYIEIEKQETVLEEILKGLGNKQPKIVLGCVQVIRQGIEAFGAKVVGIKPLLKVLPGVFEHTDKNVRAEAKLVAIELYKWIGPALKASIDGKIKPVQMKELEEEFEKHSGGPPAPTRCLRSQQMAAAVVEVASGGGGGGGGGAAAAVPQVEEIDPYDLLEAVDVLAKMPKDFYERIADVKWKERKETLEAILPLAQSPKIEGGDYGELAKSLKKVVSKDSNVVVVALAGNVITGLAKGLRKKFSAYAPFLMSAIFEKFKEKKLNVVNSLREASDAVYLTTTVANLQDECIEAMNSKNPSVKAETLLFLSRCYCQCTPPMIPKPYLKVICPVIVQRLDDTTPLVRDAACEVIGTLLKALGDRPMVAYTEGIDKTKMAKVEEFKSKVEMKISAKAAAASATSAPAPAKAAPTKTDAVEPASEKPAKKPVRKVKKKPEAGSEESASKPPSASAEKKPAASKAPAKAAASASGGGGGGKGKAKGKAAVGKFDEPPDVPEPSIPNEEVADKAGEVLPSGMLDQLADPKWKDRLAAHESFKEFVEGLPSEQMQSLLFIKVLALKPGWKDSNFQVMKAKFQVIAVLAERAAVFGKKSAAACLPALVDKLGDLKVKAQSGEVLLLIAEKMTLNFTSLQVMKNAFEHKSPKVQAESLDWLGNAVKEFGFLLNMKPHVDFIKKAFAAVNPAVRTAAINLLGTLHMYLGAQLRMFFEDEKPAILQQIDAAFEKVAGETAPAPTRGPNAAGDEEEEASGGDGGGGGGGGGGAAPVSLADLMPKVDISGQIKPDLIKDLGDKNWKVRGEALQRVQDIIAAAKFIQPSLGDLPGALKARLGDSNKNLIMTTLGIIGSLAGAIGSSCSKYNRSFVPGMLSTLTDSKSHVRASAITCLNAWNAEVPMSSLMEGEYFANALGTENPNLRAEILGWLEEKLPGSGKLPAEAQSLILPVFICLEDRSADVRKKAQGVVPVLMAVVGYDAMLRHTGKLKPASKQSVKALLDKHRASVKPPPQPAAASAPPAKAKASAKDPVKEDKPPAEPAEKPKPTRAQSASKGKSAAKGSKSKAGGEEDGAVLVMVPHSKEQRMKDDEKLKILRWNFQTPRSEHVNQLKDQMQPCVSRALHAKLFHEDFKQQLAGISMLTEAIKVEDYCDAAVGCSDLLLRWVTLRFSETNTTVNLKCLEFVQALFRMLIQQTFRMSDYEAGAFLPYLILKVGDPKDAVRKGVRGLLRDFCSFYPPTKLFPYVLDGLKSKNARQRVECLEALGELIQNNGMSVCQPSPPKSVPLIAAQICDRDNAVRSAALNAMVVVYGNVGEAVYKFTSQLSAKEVSLLEERIRRSGKVYVPALAPEPTKNDPPVPSSTKPPDMVTEESENLPEEELPPPDAHESSPPPLPVERVTPSHAPPPAVVSGPFQLDMSRFKAQPRVSKPPTVNRPDLSIFRGESQIPTFASSRLLANPPKPVFISPARIASKSSAVKFIISQVTSSDTSTSLQAIQQVLNITESSEQFPLLTPHVEQLLRAVLVQMKMNFTSSLPKASTPEALDQVMELGRKLTAILNGVFSQSELASAVSRDTLMEVERDVFGYLIDERLLELNDVAQLNRSYNVVMTRIIENANKNIVFGSLLRVMLESLNSDGSATKRSDMAMKCLWRITRQLTSILPILNIDVLLKDVEHFFRGHSALRPTPVTDDKPFRTAKTILYHLAMTMGDKVMEHLTLIKDSESQVAHYLKRAVAKKRLSVERDSKGKSSSGQSSTTAAASSSSRLKSDPGSQSEPDGSAGAQPTPPGPSFFERSDISGETSSLLTGIFDRIRDTQTTHQGLEELYDFKQSHPEISIAATMEDRTRFFQGYIQRGLKSIEQQRARGESNPALTMSAVVSDEYRKRASELESIRVRASQVANIDWTKTGSASRSPVKSLDAPTVTTLPTEAQGMTITDENKEPSSKSRLAQLPVAESVSGPGKADSGSNTQKLDDLRRRLDRLKGVGTH